MTTILSGDGTVSASHARLLSAAADDLDRLQPQLDGDAASYFDQLRTIVNLAKAQPVR